MNTGAASVSGLGLQRQTAGRLLLAPSPFPGDAHHTVTSDP